MCAAAFDGPDIIRERPVSVIFEPEKLREGYATVAIMLPFIQSEVINIRG